MKKEEKTKLTKEKIINSAITEFGTKGYEKASINNICNENKIAKGLIYHNFKNKDEIYLTCVKMVFSKIKSFIEEEYTKTMIILISFILLSSLAGFIFNNYILSSPVLNFMLIGMAFSAAYSNIVPSERLEAITKDFNPILNFSILAVILNLGYPLDYHLILGAGLFTAVYIISRAIGKYFGAYFGSAVMKSPICVKKFLGLTLLPHSGVSLVFTGIAASALASPAPESCKILQGTIAAAAVINEVITVIIAKKGFEWSGELNKV